MMKKLILVGNKIIDKDMSKEVDSFDYVVRLNRMSNYGMTGFKTDLLLVDHTNEFFKFLDKNDLTKFKSAKKLIINISLSNFSKNFDKLQKMNLFNADLLDKNDFLKISLKEISDKLISNNRIVPTNFCCMLYYLLENFKEYEIWITGIDIDNRSQMFQTNSLWNTSWHKYVGSLETNYFKNLIAKNKIKVLKIDSSDITADHIIEDNLQSCLKQNLKTDTHIYCLTIENSKRHVFQKEHLKNVDCEHSFVFGKEFSDEYINNAIKNKNSKVWKRSMFSNNKDFLKRTYSCAYGHLEMLKNFVNNDDYEYGLFIEDDVKLPSNINEKIQEIVTKYKQYDIWHLATEARDRYNKIYNNKKAPELTKNIQLKTGVYRISTAAYLTNKKGAELMIDLIGEIHGPSDVIQFANNVPFGIIYGTEIEAIFDFSAHSTIGDFKNNI